MLLSLTIVTTNMPCGVGGVVVVVVVGGGGGGCGCI